MFFLGRDEFCLAGPEPTGRAFDEFDVQ